jgi:hypothetical protein
MTKPKLAANCCVNTVVWVRKPGPIAEVAIKQAAPNNTLKFDLGTVADFVCIPVSLFVVSKLIPPS